MLFYRPVPLLVEYGSNIFPIKEICNDSQCVLNGSYDLKIIFSCRVQVQLVLAMKIIADFQITTSAIFNNHTRHLQAHISYSTVLLPRVIFYEHIRLFKCARSCFRKLTGFVTRAVQF